MTKSGQLGHFVMELLFYIISKLIKFRVFTAWSESDILSEIRLVSLSEGGFRPPSAGVGLNYLV